MPVLRRGSSSRITAGVVTSRTDSAPDIPDGGRHEETLEAAQPRGRDPRCSRPERPLPGDRSAGHLLTPCGGEFQALGQPRPADSDRLGNVLDDLP